MSRFVLLLVAVIVCASLFAAAENLRQKFPKPHAVHVLGQHDRRSPGKRRLADAKGSELAPLFPGYGTHFVYAYVGTPPQRQSLIVDTGSHYTAFPCSDCNKCGKHTDPYWNVKNSSTAVIPNCLVGTKNGPCHIEQTYTEGSSWKAYKVQDKVWIGGIKPDLVPGAEGYAMNFEFGCQTSAQGLFVTQLADGILGLSNGPDTLPAQLKANKVTQSALFALCFRIGGGILTIGGVDERIHTKKAVSYAALANNGRFGFFSVNVRNVYMKPSAATSIRSNAMLPISTNITYLAGGAAIVDSGTTDTYLPASVAESFKATLLQMTGLTMQPKKWKLTKAQLGLLPALVFRLQATGAAAEKAAQAELQSGNLTSPASYAPGTTVDVVMPWTSYLENVGEDLYNLRVGFTEDRGAVVLGSNFMNGYNVIFDAENGRIGFAASSCNYEEFDPLEAHKDDNKPALIDPSSGKTPPAPAPGAACTEDEMVPTTECSALCNRNDTAYIATGTQQWKCVRALAAGSSLDPEAGTPAVDPKDIQERPCQESCVGYRIVRGDPHCPEKPWTDCTHGCVKSRQTVPSTEKLYKDAAHKVCNYRLQTSTCYSGMCPLQEGDYLIYIDLRVRVEPWKWSYVHTENFFSAMADIFKLNINSVELLNDAGSEYTAGTKLHFKIRMKAKDYKDVTAMHYASEAIVTTVRSPTFGAQLVRALNAASLRTTDAGHLSRYGWMYGSDIEVLSAIAMPTSGIRAPQGEEGPTVTDDGYEWSLRQANLLLLGVGLAAILLLGLVGYLYYQLRQAHALYEKDKGTLSRSGQALHRMFNSLASQAAEGIAATAGVQVKSSTSASQQRQREVEMAQQRGLMDEDLED